MAFCSYCGNQVPDDAVFCKSCGKRLTEGTPIPRKEPARFTERVQEYAGKIVKCPACGEDLPSFTAICPSCGHEITSAEVSSTIKDFSDQIKKLDEAIALNPVPVEETGWKTWSIGKKIGWVLLNYVLCLIPLIIYWLKRRKTDQLFTPMESRKAAFINNYNFPNDRESIVEAILYIGNQVSQQTLNSDKSAAFKWAGIWKGKADQLYQKAEAMFPGDPMVKNTYEKILDDERKAKMPIQLWSYFKLALAVILGLFILFTFIKSAVGHLTSYDPQQTRVSDNTSSEIQTNQIIKIEVAPQSLVVIGASEILIV